MGSYDGQKEVGISGSPGPCCSSRMRTVGLVLESQSLGS